MSKLKHWQTETRITPEADEALKAFPTVIRQLLFNRGYATDETARQFLKATVAFDTSPWQLTGMERAITRLEYAILNQEPVVIYGDYDVDGVTATALLVQVLKSLGTQVREYIPNRFDEGYGLNNEALDTLKAEGSRVVITVDCGIRSLDEAVHARNLNLDLIISDHHHPGEILPDAYAIINPKQPGDAYPDKDLAGVGVAFKIAEALLERFPNNGFIKDDLLDLVALGTVADLAPLAGENRSLVRQGLRQLRQTQRQGLFSLAAVTGLDLKNINASNIGFGLGPRLNAAGRLDSALAAFKLLCSTDIFESGQLAQTLEIQNRDRQQVTRSMQAQAEKMVLEEDPDAFLLFAVDPDFNAGVVGLAASRLSDIFYRPAIVACIGETTTRGSCRSIPEFHITEALDQCADLLVRYGGHAAAAGFTVENAKLPELKKRIKFIAEKQLSGLELHPLLCADAEISLTELNSRLLEQLAWFEPTGYGNPEPVFVTRGVRVASSRAVGSDGKHLKLNVTDGYSHFDAIGFRLGDLQPTLPTYVDLLFTFELNEFNGRKNFQLNVRDLKSAERPE
ncbi:MAG: single-stranded-DNA-specific exonuclease RecJ [Chloroflexi bacterium GWB2_49_20]|nr:MAG: single-stranded-DNA-specific exonuclease RecJ [Chloroflexi bacterium GWB2_49_20]OGN76100.1 MAG: single-stranded-DNA-specific exonuclease RecJ [Chloroflexi bacterium GWC2_49_37]OGN83486.1 MAG: single-stranded-DNA-specific exonuclease RecJ [Chloroflexi bacterium GWD2_49_16]HBG73886.1 single-stranded-DNA-specific exonuclease RecJ [Anaerolineae bacterium]HCC79535.1 single-stranded-DNA-specific exonuclease RecJ [Anaerolineae bacterium]